MHVKDGDEVSLLPCSCLPTAFFFSTPTSIITTVIELTRSLTDNNPSSVQTSLPSNALSSCPGGGDKKALGFHSNYSVCVRVCVCVSVYRPRLCVFQCSPRCVRMCVWLGVCFAFPSSGLKHIGGLNDMFRSMFCWIWMNSTEQLPGFFLCRRWLSPTDSVALVASIFPLCATGTSSVGVLLMMFSARWTRDITPLGQSHSSIKEKGFTQNFNICLHLWLLT